MPDVETYPEVRADVRSFSTRSSTSGRISLTLARFYLEAIRASVSQAAVLDQARKPCSDAACKQTSLIHDRRDAIWPTSPRFEFARTKVCKMITSRAIVLFCANNSLFKCTLRSVPVGLSRSLTR